MGRVRCSEHGLSELIFVCEHIRNAIPADDSSICVEVIEGVGDELDLWHYFCQSCADEFGYKDGLRVDRLPDEYMHSNKGACRECFNSWRNK